MPYDPRVVREILLSLGKRDPVSGYVDTSNFALSPMGGQVNHPDRLEHAHLLVSAGLLKPTNDTHSKHGAEFVTLRATHAGSEWVRRAFDDAAWERSLPELDNLLGLDREE